MFKERNLAIWPYSANRLLLASFFFLYVLKQTHLIELFGRDYFQFVFGLLVISISLYLYNYPLPLRGMTSGLTLCVMFSMGAVVFGDRAQLVQMAKLFLALVVVYLWLDDILGFLELAADSVICAVLFVVFLSELRFIPSVTVAYDLWTKNGGGFLNANIPPLFVFSAILAYFVCGATNKFWLAVITYFSLMILFEIHSRTTTVGVIFVTLGSVSWMRGISVDISKFLVGTLVIFYTFLVLFPDFRYRLPFYQEVNHLSSDRLGKFADISWQFFFDGPILRLPKIDSVYFELLFTVGPLFFLYLLIFFIAPFRVVASTFRPHYFLIVMCFVGMLEGFLYKLTPITLYFFAMIFMSRKLFYFK